MLGLSDVTRTSTVRSLTARGLPLTVEGYMVYCKGEAYYNNIDKESDVIRLLLIIETIAYSFDSKSYPVLEIHM